MFLALGPNWIPWGAQVSPMATTWGPMGGQGRPIRAKAYIHKLPIHRHRAAAAGNLSVRPGLANVSLRKMNKYDFCSDVTPQPV